VITLRLWQALHTPKYHKHPLFVRILDARERSISLPVRVLIGGSILFGMFLVCGLTYVLPEWLLRQFIVLPLVLPGLYLLWVFGGTGRGVTLAGQIGAALAVEHERDTFEQLSALPGGALGAYWIVANAYLQREANLDELNRRQIFITFMGFALVTFLLFILYLNTWTRTAMEAFQFLPFVLYPLVAIYYVDYVCSLVTGVLVGALSASLTKRRLEGRLTAISVFMLLQFAGYGLTLWVSLTALPLLMTALNLPTLLARLAMAGACVLLFFLTREGINSMLWGLLAHRLDAAESEQEAVIGTL